MKTIVKVIVLLLLITAIIPLNYASAAKDVTVYINGEKVYFQNAAPLVENNSVLVPMRPLFEGLGAEVQWIQDTNSVIATLNHTKIELTIGRWVAKVNGKDIGLTVPAVIKHQSTYVPLRFVSESLGADVKWDSKLWAVHISYQQHDAKRLEKVWSMGAPSETYDWIQGMTNSSDKTIYAVDGIKIKSYKDEKEKTIFNLRDLAPQLKSYGLDDPSTIHSFRLSDMQEKDGRLYISGLMFVNKEDEIYEYYNENILLLGFTYNLIFYLEDGKPTILYIDRAKVHEKPNSFTWYETSDGRPENFYQWGDHYLYDYSRYLLKLRFTFAEDGSIIVPIELGQRHYEDLADGVVRVNLSYQSIVKISSSGEVEELMNWGSHLGSVGKNREVYVTDRHVLPVLKDHLLTVYNGDSYVMDLNLDTNTRKFIELPEEDYFDPIYLMERPLYRDGKVYFLNEKGIFTLENNSPKMLIWEQDIDFSGLDHTVYIVDFDFDGDYFYITDFTSRSIYRLKAGQ